MSIISRGCLLARSLALVLPKSRLPGVKTGGYLQKAPISTTAVRRDIMEFFDDPKNWGAKDVKHGRAWTKDELRIKSNSDLHKLWFVLLKERNMLMTMEQEYKDKFEYFPSPERVDKVKISMENLEEVVKERNRAYYELETGEGGIRDSEEVMGPLGVPEKYQPKEHLIPKEENAEWWENRRPYGNQVRKLQKMLREKETNERRRARNRNRNEVVHLLRRFPDLDVELLKERFPDVDIDKLLREDKIRPHI